MLSVSKHQLFLSEISEGRCPFLFFFFSFHTDGDEYKDLVGGQGGIFEPCEFVPRALALTYYSRLVWVVEGLDLLTLPCLA